MKYALALMLALGALFGVSAQAATVSEPATIQSEVATKGAVQKVYWHNRWRSHHRWGSRGWGWGWGWHNRWRSHYRWGSRRW